MLLLLVGCQGNNTPVSSNPTPQVRLPVIAVQRQDIRVEVNIPGTVGTLPNRSAKVSPAVAGKLIAINVVPGQQVAKGEVIARLDNRQASEQLNQVTAAWRSAQASVAQARTNLALTQNNLQRTRSLYQQAFNISTSQKTIAPAILGARAGVAQAQSNLALARTNLERQQLLYNKGIAPKKDLITAQNQLQTAQSALVSAQVAVQQVAPEKDVVAAQSAVQTAQGALAAAIAQEQQAQASRNQAQTQLSLTDIRTPIAGVVATRLLNIGDTADTATPVIQVVNLSIVIVNANLPADRQANIRVGQRAIIRSLSQQSLEGVVTAISPIVDPQSNTVNIQIRVDNSKGQLKDNQTVKVSITTEVRPGALTVPQTALVPDPNNPAGRMIYTVEAGKLARKKVQTGIQQNGQIEILSGLSANQTVVAKGAYGLPDGTAIQEVKL